MNRKHEERNQGNDSDSDSDYMYAHTHTATARHGSGGVGSMRDTGRRCRRTPRTTCAILLLPTVYSNNRPRNPSRSSPSPRTKLQRSTSYSVTLLWCTCSLRNGTLTGAV